MQRSISLALVTAAVTGAVCLTTAAGPAFAARHGGSGPAFGAGHGGRRDHQVRHTTRTLKIVATDSATSPFDDDHPSFELGLHGGEHVAAGLVRVDFVNRSKMMEHQATLARLHRGVSLRDLIDAVQEHGDGAAIGLVDFVGGANTVAPGGRQVTWQRLKRGRYVVLCLVQQPDGKSHLDLGMVSQFRVTGGSGHGQRRVPHVQGTITATTNESKPEGSKMTFTLPPDFTGHGVYRFHNAADHDVHELAIVALAPGKTRQDVIDWFNNHAGPPPFTGAGGFAAVSPGGSGWLRLHLKPGNYVATCFVPDAEPPHLPHGALGMDVAFTIG